MPIILPQSLEQTARLSPDSELTPKEIVAELDKYIIGQKAAKKAVSIALRNRFRRRKLPPELADEIAPKNILMVGPTGVGKTEISRRLAKMTCSPFLKIEASKFTEVGYVGRDVESMIRDLARISVDMVRSEKMAEVEQKARVQSEERLLDLLLPSLHRKNGTAEEDAQHFADTREKLRRQLREGRLEERMVEVEVKERPASPLEIFSNAGMEEIGIHIQEIIPGLMGGKSKRRRMKVQEARDHLLDEEQRRLIDMEQVTRLAVERVEHSGIIFLDEVDKIAGRESGRGPEVSREGV
ncbi:MAG: AAA family ATPase, partial [Candidatus Aminicenantes bacterium]|nr:AAA family ATPase [Candidatus Aminicenantes bacterium]